MPEGMSERTCRAVERDLISTSIDRENPLSIPKRFMVTGEASYCLACSQHQHAISSSPSAGQRKTRLSSYNFESAHGPRPAFFGLRLYDFCENEPSAGRVILNGVVFSLPSGSRREIIQRAVTPDPAPVLAGHEELERNYQLLGAKFGPDARSDTQARMLEAFRSRGTAAADWLIRRLRTETNAEVLEAAALLLGRIGSAALTPMIRELEAFPHEDLAECLLTAIRFLPSVVGQTEQRVSAILGLFSRHPDRDVRRSAYRATRSVARRSAIEILRSAARDETDPRLRGLIQELLQAAQD